MSVSVLTFLTGGLIRSPLLKIAWRHPEVFLEMA